MANNPLKYIDPTGMIFGLSSEESGDYDSDNKRSSERNSGRRDNGGSDKPDNEPEKKWWEKGIWKKWKDANDRAALRQALRNIPEDAITLVYDYLIFAENLLPESIKALEYYYDKLRLSPTGMGLEHDLIATGTFNMMHPGVLERGMASLKFLNAGINSYFTSKIPAPFRRQLKNGGSWLMTEEQYYTYYKGRSTVGRPDGQFMTSSSQMDDLLLNTNGDPAGLGKSLGVDGWNSSTRLYRIDAKSPLRYNPRVPNSGLSGANSAFRPGGKTIGGVSEVVVDPLPISELNATPLF